MGQDVRHPGLPQVVDEIIDVPPPALGFAVYLNIEPIDEHIHLVAILGEEGGDLLTDEEVRVVEKGQSPIYGLMVGEGDKVHTGLFRHPVGLFGWGVRLLDLYVRPSPLTHQLVVAPDAREWR